MTEEIFALFSPILLLMRRVYMSFMNRTGWYCQFLEEDLKTPLPRKLAFLCQDKIYEIANRCGALTDQDVRHAIQQGIETGRGGVWLNLTDEQYRKLTK